MPNSAHTCSGWASMNNRPLRTRVLGLHLFNPRYVGHPRTIGALNGDPNALAPDPTCDVDVDLSTQARMTILEHLGLGYRCPWVHVGLDDGDEALKFVGACGHVRGSEKVLLAHVGREMFEA